MSPGTPVSGPARATMSPGTPVSGPARAGKKFANPSGHSYASTSEQPLSMKHVDRTLRELAEKAASPRAKKALTGIDGFVDKIVHPVDRRSGMGENYTAIPTITDFAKRIESAAGKSANIELYPVVEKLGGNGPIMADAQCSLGLPVRYVGALGRPSLHPVFHDFAERTRAVSLTEPGVTHAAEFNDGKIMLGTMASLDEITYERIIEVMGEGPFMEALSEAELVSMVNWTMIPQLTSVFEALLDKALPNLGPLENRHFFFDLADPQKRSATDIANVLRVIARFQAHGRVILGLNLREAQQVAETLGLAALGETPEDLRKMADRLRSELSVHNVVIHPSDGAACATREDAWYVAGPYTERPRITTGAGDHFNAGFATGQIIGLSPEASLTLAAATSGFYVRNAKSPSMDDLETFMREW